MEESYSKQNTPPNQRCQELVEVEELNKEYRG